MRINKVIPTRIKAIPVVLTLMTGGGAAVSAQNLNTSNEKNVTTIESMPAAPNTQTNPISLDVTARTFQFLDGANMSGISTGISKNWENLLGTNDNLSAYCMAMAGYNFGNKLPTGVAMGYFDYKYPKQNNNINLSAEAYCEAAIAKGGSYVKPAFTPIKLNVNKNIWHFGFDPRVAFNFAQGQVNPVIEVLATVSAQIYKDWSAYVIGQCYAITQYMNPCKYSINLGLGRRITGLPWNKSPRKLD